MGWRARAAPRSSRAISVLMAAELMRAAWAADARCGGAG
jgi:hypothetical protein